MTAPPEQSLRPVALAGLFLPMRFQRSTHAVACVVTLLSWRMADQSEAAWLQTATSHEAEMFLIKGLVER